MKISKNQLRKMILNEIRSSRQAKSKNQRGRRKSVGTINESEYFPISGSPNRSWVVFEEALWDAAAEMVDAGFPADSVQDAMIRAVEGTIAEMDSDMEPEEREYITLRDPTGQIP